MKIYNDSIAIILTFFLVGAISFSGFTQLRGDKQDKKAPKSISVNAEEKKVVESMLSKLTQVNPDGLANAINQFNQYTFSEQPELGVQANMALANFYASQQAHRHASEHYAKSIAFINAIPDQQNWVEIRFMATEKLGDELTKENKADQALLAYQRCLQQAEVSKNSKFHAIADLKIGDWYSKHSETEKAMYYYRLAEPFASGDSGLLSEVRLKLSIEKLLSGVKLNQREADSLMDVRSDENPLWSKFYYCYAQVLLKEKFSLKAKTVIGRLDSLSKKDQSLIPLINYLNVGFFLSINEVESAESAWLEIEPKAPDAKISSLADELWDAELNRLVRDNFKFDEKDNKDHLLISPLVLIGCGLLILTLTALLVVIARSKKQHREQLETVNGAASSMPVGEWGESHEVLEHNSDGSVTKIHRNVVDMILTRLLETRKNNNLEEVQTQVGAIIFQLEDLLNHGREKSTMLTNVKQLKEDFTRRLTEAYPHLTDNEKSLCELVRHNLSAPEIAVLMNISTESAERLLTTLSTTLQIGADEDLYLVVANI